MSTRWSEVPTRRPVAVVMATASVLVFGLVSYARLPLALFPDLTYPTLTIRTAYTGAAPEEIEEAVVRPIEELVATVDGLVRMRSTARADSADVVLEFGWGWSMVSAAQDVRERLDVLLLPEGVQRPLLLRYDPALDPILRLGLHAERGSLSLGELRDYADQQLRRELERVPGVAAVSVLGGEEREVEVALDSARLAATGLSAAQVSARLRAENINVAGGDLREGSAQFLVRTLHQLRSLDAIRELVLLQRGDAFVRLGDVARVALVPRRATHRTRFAGREGVELAVFKEADANIVQTARAVRARLALDGATEAADEAAPDAGRARRGRGQAGARAERAGARGIELPGGVQAVLLTDQSRFIEAALDEVTQAAWLGGVLAMLVLYLFLRSLRATAITAVAIPVSVIVAFAPMSMVGVSLNIMSLGGLALGIGMLVDNAIVVLESIARCRDEGDGLVQAAVRGADEVGGAVTASTLTTVAVFAPMVFVEGVAGQVFGDLAMSVVSALLASLLVALTLVPMLASRQLADGGPAVAGVRHPGQAARALAGHLVEPWRRRRTVWRWALASPYLAVRSLLLLALAVVGGLLYTGFWLGAATAGAGLRSFARAEGRLTPLLLGPFDRGYQLLDGALQRALRRSLARPRAALLPALALTALAAVLLPRLGSSLVPDVRRGQFDVRVAFAVGTPLDQTLRQLEPVEARLAALPEVALLSTFAGISDELWQQSSEGEHTAQLRVQLRPGHDTAAREARVMEVARAALASIPGAEHRIERPPLFSFAAPIEVQVTGIDLEALQRAGLQVLAALRELPELDDLQTSASAGLPELHVVLQPARLAQLGLEAEAVATTVRDQVHGREASIYRPARASGERFDIVVRGDLGPLPRLRELAAIPVAIVDDQAIPLQAVAELRRGLGPVEVQHVDGARSVLLQAGLAEGVDLAAAAAAIRARVDALALPLGVDVRVAGQDLERAQAMRSLGLALLLAVFLVFAVLASQFESLRLPLLVLSTIPLGLVGAILGLAVTGTALTILALIGGITLVGIVVNNAIVLLDRVQRERRAGAALDDALCRAVSLRLRPILMTTLTTVFGLLPMVLSRGEGAELRAPIAVTLIAGLLAATLLTLVVVPVLVRLTSAREERR